MNTEALRAFVLVAELGRFQDAATDLGITQQAVSKRVAVLEELLGVPLFTRGPRGADLTVDGQAFLPHARAVLLAVQSALDSVQPGRRALRVDVLGRRLASAGLVIEFHERCPDLEIDLIAQGAGALQAFSALLGGTIDAAFCCVRDQVPELIEHRHVYDEPLDLLVGPRHPLAAARTIELADLADHRVWVPGIVAGSEWGAYYESLAGAYGIDIDPAGPNFGIEHVLDTIADSATLATFVGARTRIAWPTRHELARVLLRAPTPVYPWSLAWHTVNRHPGLAALRDHLGERSAPEPGTWVPAWAYG